MGIHGIRTRRLTKPFSVQLARVTPAAGQPARQGSPPLKAHVSHSKIMNINKIIAIPACTIVITWVARFIWRYEIWSAVEDISLGLLGITLSIKVIQDARKSNQDKKSASKIIDQLSFVFKPKEDSPQPYKKMEHFGYILGCLGVGILITVIMGIFG